MADLEAIEVLTQAKERLFECGWGRNGSMTRETHGDGESMCLEEALVGRRGGYVAEWSETPVARAAKYIRGHIATDPVFLFFWNDAQESAGPVFEALDGAILLAKEATLA